MELCAAFVVLVILFLLFTLFGHGVWLAISAVFRAVTRAEPPEALPVHRRPCIGCGTTFDRRERTCPACGLDPYGPVAVALGELEITTRNIQTLVQQHALDPTVGETIYGLLEARQTEVLGGAPLAPRTLTARAAESAGRRVPVTEEPLWVQLDRLLGSREHLADLSAVRRRRALGWYRQIENADLVRLSPGSLLKLARLVGTAGLTSRALEVYRLLLRTHPWSPEAEAAVSEAEGVATAENNPEMVRWLRNWTADHAILEAEHREPVVLRECVPATEVSSPSPVPTPEQPAQAPVPEPSAPRRTAGELLAGFMEERNILWGELVGGLLIVGCSIALVISLWQTLEQIPYFPFLIFAAITAALFGAGHYTLGHWKLESTSRGLLVIATLLTPLDFLVVAGLSRGQEAGWLGPVIEVSALVVFTLLLLASSRVLVGAALPAALGRPERWLTLAVMGSAGGQLLVPRWLEAGQLSGWYLPLGFLPVACQVLALAAVLLPLARRERLDGAAANALFLFLGQATYAVAVALVFLVYWSEETLPALRMLTMPIALAGMPVLISGALVHRLLEKATPESGHDAPPGRGLSPGVARLLGTVTTLTGMAVMLGALVLTWPDPAGLLVIGAVNAVAFTLAALRYRLPQAHAPALACLAVAALTAFHGLSGNLTGSASGRHLLTLALSPASGSLLAGLAVVLALTAELGVRGGRRLDGLYHAVGGGAGAVLALCLAGAGGVAEPGRAALVFGACGVGCLLVNLRWRLPPLSYAGPAVLAGATGFALWWADPHLTGIHLVLVTCLIEASWLLILSLLLARPVLVSTSADSDSGTTSAPESLFAGPFLVAGLAASVLAALLLPPALAWPWLTHCCLWALWLAALWLVPAWVKGWPVLFQAVQGALAVAVFIGITAWLRDQPWVMEQVRGLLEPRSWQAYALGLSGLGLGWVVLRRAATAEPRVRALLDPGWPTVDEIVHAFLVFSQLLLAIAVVFPEVVREYLPRYLPDLADFPGAFDPVQAWILLGLLGLASTLSLWGRRSPEAVLGWVVLGLTVPLLVGYGFREELAVASALRWGMAVTFLGFSGLLWARRPLGQCAGRLGIRWNTLEDVPRWLRLILLLGAALPVLMLTWWVAELGFSGQVPAGPAAASVFARLGWTVSVVVPLLLLALGLIGHGVREHSAAYISGAGHLLTVTLMGGYALGVVTSGETLAGAEAAFLLQLGVLGVAGWGLAWLAVGRWRHRTLLGWQAALGLVGCLGLYAATLPLLLSLPATSLAVEYEAFAIQAGNLPGWLGWLGTLALGVWVTRLAVRDWTVHLLGVGGFLLGPLAACTVVAWDVNGWLTYHTLTVAWTLVALALLGVSWLGSAVTRVGPGVWSDELRARLAVLLRQLLPAVPTCWWVEGFALVVVLLALGGAAADPARPYWSCAATLAVSALLAADAVWSRRPFLVYVSGLLFNVAGYLVWRTGIGPEWQGWQPDLFHSFLYTQVVSLAVASACWSLLELRLRRLATPIDLRGGWMPFPHAAVLVAVQLLAAMILVGVVGDLTETDIHLAGPLGWAALAATLAAVTLCFWDAEATRWGLPTAPWYVTGLLALGLVLHEQRFAPRELVWAATPLLGGYLAITAALVWLVPRAAWLWRWLLVPKRAESGLTPWFLPVQGLLGLLVLGLSIWLCLDFATLDQRLSGPAATGLLTLAGFLLAACWPTLTPVDASSLGKSDVARQVTLSLGCLAVVELGWAWLGPNVPVLWLHRHVVLLAVLMVFAAFYGTNLAGQVRRASDWGGSARQLGAVFAVLAAAVLAIVLVQEFFLYDPVARRVPLAWPGAVLVACLLGAALVGGLGVAAAPRWNAFGLTERGRMGCVYGAEVLLVLLLLHLRLNVPDLFPSIGQYWTLLLMTLGFVGVGLAEWLQRRGLPVLARPLQQTGLFLPLVPLVAFMLRPLTGLRVLGEIVPGFQPLFRYLDQLSAEFGLHALLWFLLGALYTLVAVLRRSSVFALLAALAANFGLWVLYHHTDGLAFVLHPQLWLIPVGLILLTAEHFNRARLSEPQSQGVRYLGLLLIYLSSTADLFITGLGNSVVLPVVLALLSVGGVLAGILLRVRAFLLLGVTFLFLVVFSQIWHAAVDRSQTWVWWASGIVLGVAILTLFALFEKRRNDMLRVIEEFKRWR